MTKADKMIGVIAGAAGVAIIVLQIGASAARVTDCAGYFNPAFCKERVWEVPGVIRFPDTPEGMEAFRQSLQR